MVEDSFQVFLVALANFVLFGAPAVAGVIAVLMDR